VPPQQPEQQTHVNSNKVDFGVAVLSGFGGGHVDDFAGTTFDDDVSALPQGRALHTDG